MKKAPVDPQLQGEGNYAATRRHRASLQKFVKAGKVPAAEQAAAPATAEEAKDLLAAEVVGQAPARR
jgi:hypothetical protein